MIKGKYTKGFTLVELLVVIAIIAILAGGMFLVLRPATLFAKARDSRRFSEIAELNKAIATAVIDQKFVLVDVASPGNPSTGSLVSTGGGWVFYNPGSNGDLSSYISQLPKDPTNTGVLVYWYAATTSAWELNTILEAPDNCSKAVNDGGNSGTSCTTAADCGINGAAMPVDTCRYEVGTSLSII